MRLVIGGAFQGKTDWVRRTYGIEPVRYTEESGLQSKIEGQRKQKETGSRKDGSGNGDGKALSGIHLLVRDLLRQQEDTAAWFDRLCAEWPDIVLIGDEVGHGIVPADPFEREWREAVGRLYCALASGAEEVVRVSCGIGIRLKESCLSVFLFRHGRTKGNLEGRYVGRTDEPLEASGREELLKGKALGWYPAVERAYVSPMSRCAETARLIYPDTDSRICEDLRECEFGEFEYCNYGELNGNPDYQAYIDSGGELAFPGGESKREFTRRCAGAFREIVKEALRDQKSCIAIVAHGGTLMAVLDQYSLPAGRYFDWQTGNGRGYRAVLVREGGRFSLRVTGRLTENGWEEYQ